MRIALAFLSMVCVLFSSAQDAIRPGEIITHVNATAKALAAASSNAERDSLNSSMKEDIRMILGSAEGHTVSLEELKLSRIDSPDKSFRLITWNVPRDNGTHLYEGMLLHLDGKKSSLHELRDMTPEITSPEVPELGPDRWYGALYYQMVPVKRGGKTYYTLLGWKGHDRVETRKVIEVLHFKAGKPRFGAPVFGGGKLRKTRQVFSYSFQATMTLRYDQTQNMIVLDHLSPSRPDLEGQYAFYGPDLSFDAYVWDKDHWRFERDIDARNREKSDKPYKAPPPEPRP